jgi:predicted DNA-binding protein
MPKYTATVPETSLTLPPELDYRLENFARLEGITKSALAQRAIENYLEDIEDITEAKKVLADIQHGKVQVMSLAELGHRLGLDN